MDREAGVVDFEGNDWEEAICQEKKRRRRIPVSSSLITEGYQKQHQLLR
jgi:hypothetical protein